MEAIFMVGEQRSGSNLLRLMLNQSKNITCPHPPHILQRMMPFISAYGDLCDEDNFRQLIDDVCWLVELNPIPWEGLAGLNRNDVRRRCRENSLIAVFGAIMDIYAETHQSKAWLCKSMQNIRWAKELDAYFGLPKYIYLYRDGRDVALSFSKAVIGEKHVYASARQWAELQRLCLAERKRIGPDRFFSVRYEHLIREPETVLQALCDFLDITFTEEMLSYYYSSEAKQTANSSALWENVSRPIMQANSRKFMQEMSEYEIRIVESVAGDVLDRLGYERVYIMPGEEIQFSQGEIAYFEMKNEHLKQEKAATVAPQDQQRRRRQLAVLDKILVRAKVSETLLPSNGKLQKI